MAIQAFADAISTTFTDERYPLGTLRYQTDQEVKDGGSGVSSAVTWALLKGERTWVFVKAAEAVTKGQLCEIDGGGAFQVEPNDGNAVDRHLLAGVADHDIAANSYGWIVKNGACVALAPGAMNAALLALDSDGGTVEGQVATTAGAAGSIGYSLEAADATLADYAQVIIRLP
jgi:hypothetical protein